jgi:hypothetical protein
VLPQITRSLMHCLRRCNSCWETKTHCSTPYRCVHIGKVALQDGQDVQEPACRGALVGVQTGDAHQGRGKVTLVQACRDPALLYAIAVW